MGLHHYDLILCCSDIFLSFVHLQYVHGMCHTQYTFSLLTKNEFVVLYCNNYYLMSI